MASIIKNKDGALSAIRNLHPDYHILLMTPYIPLSVDIDPFEPLGRAISQHHRRVRHVPYVPEHGFTYIHQAHLAAQDVVAVVVVAVVGDSQEQQIAFAKAVREAAADELPIVLLLIGGKNSSMGFNTVLKSESFSAEAFTGVADLIFGSQRNY